MKRTAAVLLAVCLAGCRGGGSGSAPSAKEASGEFVRFVDTYFDSYFRFNPTQGTAAGLHQYDTLLEPWSADGIQKRIAALRSQETALEQIRSRGLSPDDSVDASILLNRIRGELLDLETIRWWRRNPLMYAVVLGSGVDGLMKREFAPGPDRLRSVTARLRLMPAFLGSMRNNIGEVPRELAELSIRVLRGSIPFFRDDLPKWAASYLTGDDVLRADFTSSLRAVVTSMEVAAASLEKEVLPLSSPGFAIGTNSFVRKLQYDEMVDTPLPRLLEIGEANLAKDYEAFVQVSKQFRGARSPADAMKQIASEHPTESGLISSANQTADSIRQYVLDHKIIDIPSEVRAKIVATPPYMRASGFALMDTPGAYEANAREAFYYITPTEPGWTASHKEQHLRLFNRPVMDIITVHEAYPGHYVQFLYAKQFPTRTRKLVACGTNAEGWAHYAEQMMVEQGFGGGSPGIRLAQLSEALVRDVRYVAGIRMHTQGMTTEQAQRLFVDRAFMDEETALEEARRAIYDPIYLYYTLGKLQIYKLRADYEKARGGSYSLSAFHSDFVRQGAIPLPLVRQILLPGDSGPTI